GQGQFLFSTALAGISAIGQLYVGFGTAFTDFDNDGWEDIAITNGHVIRFPSGAGLRQKPVLLRNQGPDQRRTVNFADVPRHGGPYYRSEHIGRGLALGDLDNDGWPDLVISHLNEPVVLLRNEAKETLGKNHHWLGIDLAGQGNRDLVGTKLVVEAAGRK